MRSTRSVGELLREWRERRRVTQIELAGEAEVSTRHLSFLENGRAQPSRDMLLCLAEKLDIPLRERNTLFLAAGYAPIYPQRSLTAPELQLVRNAIDVILTGHEPYPAIAVDRHWTLMASNSAVAPLLAGIDPSLLAAPVNVLRFTLHPLGLAPRIANYAQWRLHVFEKLRSQIEASHDPLLVELLREFREYPVPGNIRIPDRSAGRDGPAFAIPFQLVTDAGVLSFFSTTTIFGTPLDVALSEISLECFYPADGATIEALRESQGRRLLPDR